MNILTTNKNSETYNQLDLRQSNKDLKWYNTVVRALIPHNKYLNNFVEKKKYYEVLNGDLSSFKEDVRKLCSNLIEFGIGDEDILFYNKIQNKLNILIGDMLSMSSTENIILLHVKAIEQKDEELKQQILESVEAELSQFLTENENTLRTATPEQIQQLITDYKAKNIPRDFDRKTFMSEIEMYKYNMLKYIKLNEDITAKKIDTLKTALVESKFAVLNTWVNGRPTVEVLNTLRCDYDLSPNQPFFEKGDYFLIYDDISVGDCIQEYGNELSNSELQDAIRMSSYSSRLDKGDLKTIKFDDVMTSLSTKIDEGINTSYYTDEIGLHQSGRDQNGKFRRLVGRKRLFFKAFDKVIFHTYYDERGEQVSEFLDGKSGIIPEDASELSFTNRWQQKDIKYVWVDEMGSEHECEIFYIPQEYEIHMLADDLIVRARKVPFKPIDEDDPFNSFELSVKGTVINNTNAEPVSWIEIALPYMMQIVALKNLQNREIAAYEGFIQNMDVDQIPEDLAINQEGDRSDVDAITNAAAISRKTKRNVFSGSQTRNNLPPPPTRAVPYSAMQIGSAAEILNFQMLIDAIDAEMGVAIGVPKAREGQTEKYSTASANLSDLQQSTLTTRLIFYYLNKVWGRALNANLEAWDVYWKMQFENYPNKKNILLEYLTPQGTRELIKVLPEYLEHSKIGLFVGDTNQDQLYTQYMLQNSQVIGQNPESAVILSELYKSISSGASKEEVHRLIQMAADRVSEQQQALQQQQAEQMQQVEEMKQRNFENQAKYLQNLRTEAELIIQDAKRQTTIQKAEIDAKERAMAQDIDNNKIPDTLQVAKAKHEHDAKENEKDRRLQEKDRESKEKLEKEKLEIERMKVRTQNKNKS